MTASAQIEATFRAEAGRDVSARTGELYARRQSLPLYARAFLLMALHRGDPQGPAVRTLTAELLGNIRELPATAHTGEDSLYALDEFFTSDGRSDAIVLMALLRAQPQHAVVPKLAAGLLERRLGGVWRNTQENAYALVALADYARVHEADVPNFSARAWVAGANILDAKFTGRELATRSGEISMAKILNLPQTPGQQLLPVILQRQGQGRLYYRLGAEWAPSNQADLPAREQGLRITRALRSSTGTATTSVAAGEPIAMDITLESHTRVRYVVLDLPLPAGLEGVSRSLGKGRGASVLAGGRGWWVSHEELRPDRVVVYADDEEDSGGDDDGGDDDGLRDAYVRASALAMIKEIREKVDQEATELVDSWFAQHRSAIKSLSDVRQQDYEDIRAMTTDPQRGELGQPRSRMEDYKVLEDDDQVAFGEFA